MRPFKKFKTIRFFRAMSQMFLVILLVMLLLNKFNGPLGLWLLITAFFSLPFIGVMFWIDRARIGDGEFSMYFMGFLFNAACFIAFGLIVMREYLNNFGLILFIAIQIVFTLLVYLKTEKFGRHLGQPPINTKSTLRFY